MLCVICGIWVFDVGVDVYCEDIFVGYGGGDVFFLILGVGFGLGDVDYYFWVISVEFVVGLDGVGVVDYFLGGGVVVVVQVDVVVGEDEVFFGGVLGEGQGEGEKEEGGLGEVYCDCVNVLNLK